MRESLTNRRKILVAQRGALAWHELRKDKFQEGEKPHQSSQRWLRSKSMLHSTLTNGNRGKK